MLPHRQRKLVMTGYNSTLFATVTARCRSGVPAACFGSAVTNPPEPSWMS
jgi:hypothetical protein